MTTNQDRAAEVLGKWHGGAVWDTGNPNDLAQDLADAGLLAPDLPEPDRGMFGGGSVWYTNIRFAHDIRTSRNGNVVVMSLDSQDHPYRIVATPDEIDTFITYLAAASAAARAEKEPA